MVIFRGVFGVFKKPPGKWQSENPIFFTNKGGPKSKFYLQIHIQNHNKISISDPFEHFYVAPVHISKMAQTQFFE